MIVVFNRMPDLVNKAKDSDTKDSSQEIFTYDEIKKINSSYVECPFTQNQLEELFEIESLRKLKKIKLLQTWLMDVNEKQDGKKVFEFISNQLDLMAKEEMKAEQKKQK